MKQDLDIQIYKFEVIMTVKISLKRMRSLFLHGTFFFIKFRNKIDLVVGQNANGNDKNI